MKKVSNLRQSVYALAHAMDLLRYKADSGYTVRSGLHDTEHIIYAAASDIFVTFDNKLKLRTELIYKVLGIQTKVMHWEEYIECVDALAKNRE